MTKVYTLWDEDNEKEIVGTIEELEEYFRDAYVSLTYIPHGYIEVIWDYYDMFSGYYDILKVEEE